MRRAGVRSTERTSRGAEPAAVTPKDESGVRGSAATRNTASRLADYYYWYMRAR